MAHFAQLDANNVVTEVIVINNEVIEDLPFPQSEPLGVAFCQSLYGADTVWKQTSYNNSFRKQYAGIGYEYLSQSDVFVCSKPADHPSWVLNSNYDWAPPIPRPTDSVYVWDEPSVSWSLVPKPYPSWVMSDDCKTWLPPTPRPNDGNAYAWDEPTKSWVLVSELASGEFAP
jgi:hypothetical protein